jgi:hypothetical protein
MAAEHEHKEGDSENLLVSVSDEVKNKLKRGDAAVSFL